MQWDDPRLSWNQSQWKVNHLQIHSANHVWMPVLSSQVVIFIKTFKTSNNF